MKYSTIQRESTLSTFYVLAPVAFTVNGVDTDWTADTVEVAIVAPTTTPASGDWHTATVEIDATTTPPTRMARLLVGPGGVVQLTVGVWIVFSRIHDNPEVPVLRHSAFEVF